MSHFLGIDFGTSGCRACLIDADTRPLALQHTALPAPSRRGNRVEQDPALWWQGLSDTFDALAGQHALDDVAAVCLDGTSSTLLVCDAGGRPLAPALMYNDARTAAEAERIARHAPAGNVTRSAGSSLARLLWLLDQPGSAGAAHALHQADWLAGRLCGRFDVSDEHNALKLGYDPVNRRWPDWLAALPRVEALLPRVVPAGHPVDTLTGEACRRWGFDPGTRVVGGTTDSTAGVIATGAGPGDAVTTLGSTLVLKVFSESPVFAPELGVYSHRLGDHWLAGGASNSGGAVLTRFFSGAEIARYTQQLRPDAPTGLDYYPLPAAGERFPVNDPALPPRLLPRPDDDARFFQAILEGITAIEVQGYRVLAERGAPRPQRVLTTGGGAVNEPWRQMRERALGIPVRAAGHRDAAYGAALLAMRSE